MARPSIVPIALTLDDRVGYTLWAPPWEEDGEEWQAFLGTTEDGGTSGSTARVHLFPTPAALAAFCRTSTNHDLADHPVWPVVSGLGAPDLTPDEEHRYDLDGVYDIVADNPDRWAVEELAATIDIVGRLAECLDTDDEDTDDEDTDDEDTDDDLGVSPPGGKSRDENTAEEAGDDEDFEAVAELVARPEVGSLGLGVEAFVGRSGEESWLRLGGTLDELWEDVLEELTEHLDWTGAGTVTLLDYPPVADAEDADADQDTDDDDQDDDQDDDEEEGTRGDARRGSNPAGAAPATSTATSSAATMTAGTSTPETSTPETSRPETSSAGMSTIRSGSRITATHAAVATAAKFWEAVGILPVELVVLDGAGVTLRCYVEDVPRFLGREGDVFLFATPADLARFCAGSEPHDLAEIASWPDVAVTDTLPLPAEQDRYDLTELAEVLSQVAGGAGGLVDHRVFIQPLEGVRDIAEYAGLSRVAQLLGAGTPLGQALARGEQPAGAVETLSAEDAAVLGPAWDDVVTEVGSALVFRD